MLFRSGLEKLIATLAVFDSDEARLYGLLAQGYLAELVSEPDVALGAYQQIIDQDETPVLEDALIRIATLSLAREHVDDARMAYQCLIGISPSYLPQYAELLRAAGDMAQALEIYAEYVEQFPEDIPTIVRLADLYRQLDSPEAVREMCQYLLTLDPENDAAKHMLRELDEADPSQKND